MPDPGPFLAVFCAFVFGAAAYLLIEAALRISDCFAEPDQSPSPADLTAEPVDVARTVRG